MPTVKELQTQLRAKNLPTSGSKSELMRRLENADNPIRLDVDQEAVNEAKSSASDISVIVDNLQITNEDEYRVAGELMSGVIYDALKQLDDAFDHIVAMWYQGHKSTIATKKRLAKPFEDATTRIKQLREDYRRRKEEEHEREQAAKRLLLQENIDDQLIDDINKAVENNNMSLAEDLLSQLGQEVTTPVVAYEPPKSTTSTIRKLPRFDIVDESQIKREYMEPNRTKIQKIVNKHREEAEKIVGGIKFREVRSEARKTF